MARAVHGSRLDTRGARQKLPVQREPHWVKIAKGCFVGYRKTTGNEGSWIARFRDRLGKQHHKAIGAADDVMDADNDTALSFEQAQARARDWFQTTASLGTDGRKPGTYTVADCMADYLAYIRMHRKSHHHLDTYANAYIIPRLGKLDTAELTTAIVRNWHEGIAQEPPRLRTRKGRMQAYRAEDPNQAEALRKRRLRANRHLVTLKAALSYAWRNGHIAHKDAWERVRLFGGVERQRTRFLSIDEAKSLLTHCGPDLRLLVQAALLTGARYGELCALDVRDFHLHAGTLLIRDSKSGKPRHVYLNEEGAAFFQALTEGRKFIDPLLTKTNGGRWGRDLHFRPFKEALKRAGIEAGFTFHELRHTWASLTIMAGAPLMVVAQNLGHRDTRMVERHYGHLASSYVRDVIRQSAPTFGGNLTIESTNSLLRISHGRPFIGRNDTSGQEAT